MEDVSTFTVVYDRIATVLHTKLGISKEVLPETSDDIEIMETIAIWDTGASGSCITSKAVQLLGLIPYSKLRVLTASGEVYQNVYKVCFHLPHKVSINLPVTEVPALQNKFEALVGMNIISKGDLAISNYDGRTCLTFRMPSQARTDYSGTVDATGKLPDSAL